MTCGNGRNELTMGGREWVMLLALAALWGSPFFFFKVMVGALPPLTVVLARVGIAALLLNAWPSEHPRDEYRHDPNLRTLRQPPK